VVLCLTCQRQTWFQEKIFIDFLVFWFSSTTSQVGISFKGCTQRRLLKGKAYKSKAITNECDKTLMEANIPKRLKRG
jgi:hypothetical protein